MNSPFTGKKMKLVVRPSTIAIRKEHFAVMHQVWQCVDTGEEFEYDVDGTIEQAKNQYRCKYNLPFPEEIQSIREQYGISAAKMSAVLRFGINQYKQYESGELPSESNASLIFLAKHPADFCQLVALSNLTAKEKAHLTKTAELLLEKQNQWRKRDWTVQLLMGDSKPTIERGFRKPDLNKLGGMALFFAIQMSPFKTALNKLLFYGDFFHFKRFGHSISGTKYRAIEMGPVPNNFDGLFQYLENEQFITAEHHEYPNGSIGTRFLAVEKHPLSNLLDNNELETLQLVVNQFKNLSVREIIRISHQETAWEKHVTTHSIIPYLDSFLLKAFN